MELYLQFGYGMMGHSQELISSWSKGTVILSPRDLNQGQVYNTSGKIHSVDGNIWIDPQMYLPHSDHHRLTNHPYWPSDYQTSMLSGGRAMDTLFENLKAYNDRGRSDAFIIPGLYAQKIDAHWLESHTNLVNTAAKICPNYQRFATICIAGSALRNEDDIEMLLNTCEDWNIQGFYVVPEHPKNDYLVADVLWLSNLLLLTAGLKLQNKKVVVGYCSHQMLCLAPTMTDAICSGTWLNVRSFPPSKFNNPEENDKRRVTWYYCPQALSEYKITFLDMAHKNGILDQMRPPQSLGSHYADILFPETQNVQPSSVDYKESMAFRHYLQCLHQQVAASTKNTYQETLDEQMRQLDNTEDFLRTLKNNGVSGQERDFSQVIDINRAALSTLNKERGAVLKRMWRT